MNNRETYVSLETAKLLKQAGFDWKIYDGYILYGNGCSFVTKFQILHDFNGNNGDLFDNYLHHKEILSRPTLAVAQKWLREVKGWEAQVAYRFDENGHKTYVTECGNPEGDLENYIVHFSIYEEALEACIMKCLEIILNN